MRPATTIAPDTADWIAEHVLPGALVSSYGGLRRLRYCACSYSASQHCSRGRHRECAHTTHPGWYADRANQAPSAYLHDTSGGIVHDHRGPVVLDVPGPRCRWRCLCPCHTRPDGGLFPLSALAAEEDPKW